MDYVCHTDAELTAELTRLKTAVKALNIKWQAGDTSVEKDLSKSRKDLSAVVAEIRRRPDLASLVQRQPITRTRAVFS